MTMDAFPSTLTPQGAKVFPVILEKYILRSIREEVYVHVLENNRSSYYDLSAHKFCTHPSFKKLVRQVMTELEVFGWKTTLSYGETALFVYTGDMPENCW